MKIGVISDTHIPERASAIPPQVLEGFKGVDLILHAGDLVDLSVLEELKKIAKVRAVVGNMDSEVVSKGLPKKEVIQANNFSVFLLIDRCVCNHELVYSIISSAYHGVKLLLNVLRTESVNNLIIEIDGPESR